MTDTPKDMKDPKRQFSIVISPPGGQAPIRIGVSTLAVKLVAVLAVVLALALLLGAGHLGHLYRKVVLYQDILSENRRLRRQNELLTQVETRMKDLKMTEGEMRTMLAGPLPGGMKEAIQAIGGDSAFNAMLESRLAADNDSLLLWPNDGPITRGFEAGAHPGLDIAGQTGSPVRAAAAGMVVFAGWDSTLGYSVLLDHGRGRQTRYGHNDSLDVRVGDIVTRGQVVARLGNTGQSSGPHVHFEYYNDGVAVSPLQFLRAR